MVRLLHVVDYAPLACLAVVDNVLVHVGDFVNKGRRGPRAATLQVDGDNDLGNKLVEVDVALVRTEPFVVQVAPQGLLQARVRPVVVLVRAGHNVQRHGLVEELKQVVHLVWIRELAGPSQACSQVGAGRLRVFRAPAERVVVETMLDAHAMLSFPFGAQVVEEFRLGHFEGFELAQALLLGRLEGPFQFGVVGRLRVEDWVMGKALRSEVLPPLF